MCIISEGVILADPQQAAQIVRFIGASGGHELMAGNKSPAQAQSGRPQEQTTSARSKFAELLLNYRLQMRVCDRNWEAPNANKTRENRSVRIGQVQLANRRIQPLCHLSAV
jgi:hypothetical protein